MKFIIKNIIKNECYRNLLILFAVILLLPLITRLFNNRESFQMQEEEVESLRRKVEELRKTYTKTKDSLNKCMNKDTLKNIVEQSEELEEENRILNSRLTEQVANQGSSCKKLSEYNIEDHPDFKKRNYDKPCFGCNI